MIKFSIVIPAYNNLELLKSALESVFIQNYDNYEIIIVDDSQGNEIDNYIEQLGVARIRYYHNSPSKGAVLNWNYGLSLSTGNAIIVLHHDEAFINNDYLKRISQLLNVYDAIVSNKKVLTPSGVKRDHVYTWYKRLAITFAYPIFSLNVIGPCACICCKKEICTTFDDRMHWLVDVDWYFRLLKKAKKTKYLKSLEILSHHGHQDQITKNINVSQMRSADEDIVKEKYQNIIVNLMLKEAHVLRKLKTYFEQIKRETI